MRSPDTAFELDWPKGSAPARAAEKARSAATSAQLLDVLLTARGGSLAAALMAAGNNPRRAVAEDALVAFIATHGGRHVTPYAHSALSHVGTSKSLAVLEAGLDLSFQDGQTSAVYAIGAIGRRDPSASVVPLLLQALDHRSWAVKWYAMAELNALDDERALDAIIVRVRAMLRRRSERRQSPKTELQEAVEFLARHSDDADAKETLRWIAAERWATLNEVERAWWVSRSELPTPA